MSETIELLTTEEVAKMLRTGASQVRDLVTAGRLAAINIATGKKRKTLRFDRADVNAFIERSRTMPLPVDPEGKPIRKRRDKLVKEPFATLSRFGFDPTKLG